jgi:hypothetical protein
MTKRDPKTGRKTGKAEERYMAAQTELANREVARRKVISYLEILEENTSDAEKDGNVALAEMLATFRDALYRADVNPNGTCTVILDLNKAAR